MDNHLLDLYISKVKRPSLLSIEYKVLDINDEDEENFASFNNSVER